MSVNFPPKPDVRLENAPLEEVICQVRFSPILRISNEEPSEFQEEIRDRFPRIEVEHGMLFRIPGLGSGAAPSTEGQTKIYQFRTLDGRTAISLTADFYAISTTRYTHWDDFAQNLMIADGAVQSVYKPSFAARIGLRYINRLTLVNTGCQSLPELLDFLHPDLTVYSRSDVWADPLSTQFRLLLADGEARLALRTEQGTNETGQPFLVLDFDYFEEGQLPFIDLVERCNRYHNVIYRAFRWCIPDEKLEAFNTTLEGV